MKPVMEVSTEIRPTHNDRFGLGITALVNSTIYRLRVAKGIENEIGEGISFGFLTGASE